MSFTEQQKKLAFIREYIALHLPLANYETAVTFIAGMDYQADGQLLEGFEDWLHRRFRINSSASWGALVADIFERDRLKPGAYEGREDRLEFLFEALQNYLGGRL